MSKIVTLLFVVLVASAADAIYRRDHLKSLKKRLESYFATHIDAIEEKYNAIKSIVKEKSELLYYNSDGNSIYAKASDNVFAILNKTQNETRELILQAQSVNGTEDCDEMVNNLNVKADSFLSHVFRCTDNILVEADERISDIESKYERLHSGLIVRRSRFPACLHKINNDTEVNTNLEVDEANMCMMLLGNNTKQFIAESVPHVFAYIDDTTRFLLDNVNPTYLATCLEDYDAFQKKATDLTNRIKQCYQQKINEAAAVDAFGTKDQLKSLQDRLESYFATEIDRIEEKYNTTQLIIREKSAILYNTNGNPIYAKASDDVYAIMIKAEAEVRELIIQTQNTSAPKECDKMTKIFKITTDFLAQVYDCIVNELSVARERISVMDSEYERLHSSLIDRRSRIAGCHSIIDNTEEIDTAISCLEALEKETRSFMATSVPSVFAKINDNNNYLSGRLESRLVKCSNGYVGLRMEAAHLTGRAKICYQQKIDEAAVHPTQ